MQRPDILISPSGKLVAFRAPDGTLILSSNRAERLVRETWLRRNGQMRFDDIGDLEGTETWLRCDADTCDYAGRVRVFLSESDDAMRRFGTRDHAARGCRRLPGHRD